MLRRENMQLENINIQSQHMNLYNTATESCILGDQTHILGVLLEGKKLQDENYNILRSDSGFVGHGWSFKMKRFRWTAWMNQKHLSKCTCFYSEAVAGKSAQRKKWSTCRTEQHVRTELNGKRIWATELRMPLHYRTLPVIHYNLLKYSNKTRKWENTRMEGGQ